MTNEQRAREWVNDNRREIINIGGLRKDVVPVSNQTIEALAALLDAVEREAVVREREACAVEAEKSVGLGPALGVRAGQATICAAFIRARGRSHD